MVILYAFQDQMAGIFQHRFRDMGKWGREVMGRRQGIVAPAPAVEIQALKPKPRGLQKLGLRWRKPREVFEEEDGISVRSINGERMSESQKRK